MLDAPRVRQRLGGTTCPPSLADLPRLAIVVREDMLHVVRLVIEVDELLEPLPILGAEKIHPARDWAQVKERRMELQLGMSAHRALVEECICDECNARNTPQHTCSYGYAWH